jgi:hypothetical protein
MARLPLAVLVQKSSLGGLPLSNAVRLALPSPDVEV